jgi:hypothetical protein
MGTSCWLIIGATISILCAFVADARIDELERLINMIKDIMHLLEFLKKK